MKDKIYKDLARSFGYALLRRRGKHEVWTDGVHKVSVPSTPHLLNIRSAPRVVPLSRINSILKTKSIKNSLVVLVQKRALVVPLARRFR
jgi:hypothetical protein